MVTGPASSRIGCTAVSQEVGRHVEEHERHADRDRRVGDVEGPEVPVVPVGVDEVEHVAGAWRGRSGCRWRRRARRRCRARATRLSAGRPAAYQATPASAPSATSMSTTVLNGKSTPFSMPNAAPVLCTRVRLSQPGTTSMLSCSAKRPRTSALVSWSSDHDGHRDDELEAAHRRAYRLTGSASASTQRGHRPARPGSARSPRARRASSART